VTLYPSVRKSSFNMQSSHQTLLEEDYSSYHKYKRRRRSDVGIDSGGPIKKAARGFFDMDEKFTKKDKFIIYCLTRLKPDATRQERTQKILHIVAYFVLRNHKNFTQTLIAREIVVEPVIEMFQSSLGLMKGKTQEGNRQSDTRNSGLR